jgi:H+/Cl- antiporter ClcA
VAGDFCIYVALGVVVGVLAGAGSFAFLRSLTWATQTRTSNGWLLWLLPVAGYMIGATYHYVGGTAQKGANLVFEEMNAPSDGAPQRMAPLVLVGATITHLFGGSGGREGAAVQIAAGLSAWLKKFLSQKQRSVLLVASVAGGFGSVFGVPFAGTIFALEVPRAGGLWLKRNRYARNETTQPGLLDTQTSDPPNIDMYTLDRVESIGPAAAASFVGDRVTRLLGIHHELPKAFPSFAWTLKGMVQLLVLSTAFGLLALAFIELTHLIKKQLAERLSSLPLRPFVGGITLIALVGVGNVLKLSPRSYLGLSLPLISVALAGGAVAVTGFAIKLLFTSVTIGSGFPGGEVTPLFCMGACLGSVLAKPLGIGVLTAVALGYVVAFAAASNTPVACSILGVEIFGLKIALPLLLCAHIATVVKGRRSVYSAQLLPGRSRPRDAPSGAPSATP